MPCSIWILLLIKTLMIMLRNLILSRHLAILRLEPQVTKKIISLFIISYGFLETNFNRARVCVYYSIITLFTYENLLLIQYLQI